MILWLTIFAFLIPLIYVIVNLRKEKNDRDKRLKEIADKLKSKSDQAKT
jgi:hypothetical protein